MTGSTERLQLVLYLLLRDKINFGALESVIAELEKCSPTTDRFVFSEELQGQYSLALAKRILWGHEGP